MKGFTFWENYYTVISDPDNGLSDDEKGQLYKALIEYIFDGRKPELKGVTRAIFSALLPSLDLSKTRSKSKRRKIKTKTNANQNEIKTETKSQFDFLEEKAPPKKEKVTQKENNTQEKEEINLSPPIIPQWQKIFFEENSDIVFDNYDGSALAGLTEEDWKTITEQFRKSEWLRRNVKTTSMLFRLSARIVAGQYAPFEKTQTEQDELSEDERRKNAEWFAKTFGEGG